MFCRSFVTQTPTHTNSIGSSDDEDDSGLGNSLLHNTSNVQLPTNNELLKCVGFFNPSKADLSYLFVVNIREAEQKV